MPSNYLIVRVLFCRFFSRSLQWIMVTESDGIMRISNRIFIGIFACLFVAIMLFIFDFLQSSLVQISPDIGVVVDNGRDQNVLDTKTRKFVTQHTFDNELLSTNNNRSQSVDIH